jgi:hypothetical protein
MPFEKSSGKVGLARGHDGGEGGERPAGGEDAARRLRVSHEVGRARRMAVSSIWASAGAGGRTPT